MELFDILTSKPVLIGLHLGFAIIGIDAFLWLLGEVKANAGTVVQRTRAALIGLGSYVLAWVVGGYYYVVYYGPLVKPIIKSGKAPWAHGIAMEAKEHVFLFAIPLAMTVLFLSRLDSSELENLGLRRGFLWLLMLCAGLGLSIGALGFIISAAARWGAI